MFLDEGNSGRPKIATIDELIVKVDKIVMDDRRLIITDIAEAASTSHECVHTTFGYEKSLIIFAARVHYYA